MYKNSAVHYIAKTMVDIMFFGGIIAVAALPVWLPWLLGLRPDDYSFGYMTSWTQGLFAGSKGLTIFGSVLAASGICAVYILFQLKRMFRTLLGGNPFVEANISCFRRIAVACALVCLIYIVKSVLLFTYGSVVIAVVFLIGCLFCLTLKDIFKQAIALKEENDLTI